MTEQVQRSHTKLIVIILSIFTLLVSSAIYFGVVRNYHPKQTMQINGVYLPKPQDVMLFNLTDNEGNHFTSEHLKGHWTMVFFGFTNCGSVCPTTMAALNEMYKILQQQLPDKKLPQVVMISVDPARDTVQRLNEYVKSFNPHFKGARGDEDTTGDLEDNMHVAVAKMQSDSKNKDNYTINHSAEIMVINPQGKLQAFLSAPHVPAEMAADYKLILKNTVS